MKRRIVLMLALMIVTVALALSPTKLSAVPSVQCVDCELAHDACYAQWKQDWYNSCIYIEGGEHAYYWYDTCHCRSTRGYKGCMDAHGCSSKARAWLLEVGDMSCFTPQ